MGNKSDKLFEKSGSHSDTLRTWAVKYLEDISGSIAPAGGLATEATLNSILNNMIASQDVEILLVRDTVTSLVYQQIREYDQGTGVWTTRYEDVNGGAFIPVNPMVYLDPSGVLNLVLTELVTLNAKDFATETTLVDVKTATEGLNTPTTALGVSMLRVSSAGAASVSAGKRRVSFFNAGNNDSTVAGATLKKGEVVTFVADGVRDTLSAITYDALTSELLITTVG